LPAMGIPQFRPWNFGLAWYAASGSGGALRFEPSGLAPT
jgi:hypothetical protein